MRPYSPGGSLNALAAALMASIPPTPSEHCLGLGLPVYLIPFAPLAFAPQRQLQARKPPSPLVFLRVSTHFTATPGVPLPSPALTALPFPAPPPRWAEGFPPGRTGPPTRALRPVIPDNARLLRITAAAGT